MLFLADELIFVEEGQELTRTLSNEECQQWMSNETHYEGDLGNSGKNLFNS